MTLTLIQNADVTHEDAREWYESYGWHLTTENAGDVTLQAVEYDWLDGTDEEAVVKLLASDGQLSSDEATSIVERARTVRDAAVEICGALENAVLAYGRKDVDEVVTWLDEARSLESDHGDSPASNSLRSAMLQETVAMTLDIWQGDDEQGRKFGYVCGDDGGYFFTHLESLDATIASLEVDEQDGDGDLELSDVADFLRDRLTAKPLASFRC